VLAVPSRRQVAMTARSGVTSLRRDRNGRRQAFGHRAQLVDVSRECMFQVAPVRVHELVVESIQMPIQVSRQKARFVVG
jgi:hypothetical protein